MGAMSSLLAAAVRLKRRLVQLKAKFRPELELWPWFGPLMGWARMAGGNGIQTR